MPELLRIDNLRISFRTPDGVVSAVNGVSLDVTGGETLGLVGESGCGKSVTALAVMGLIPIPPGRIDSGKILYRGRDILRMTSTELRAVRGKSISMIFQDSMTSLNPVFSVGEQLIEVICLHQRIPKRQARERAIEMLDLVGIASPEHRVDDYPFQMSGGMRQRVMIAIALSCHPEILIADEPTTALDVTIQAQILELVRTLQERLGTAIILISHDLGVVAEVADKVAVMYCGRIVEQAPVADLYGSPRHPYTVGLLEAIPKLHVDVDRLRAIPGTVPIPGEVQTGCPFKPRCPAAGPECATDDPALRENAPGHLVACHHPHGERGRA